MSTNGFNSQPDDNQSPQPDSPASPAASASDAPFTDWREQLRERVQEIRARKLAGKRGEDSAVDFAEQAAAARAEKLRAAREATVEVPLQSTEPITSSARIERLIEEVSEEVAGQTADSREAEVIATRPLSIQELADTGPEQEPVAPAAVPTPEPDPEPAAATETAPEEVPTLGNADRTARRSEIADVVDAFLDPAPSESEVAAEAEPDAIDATLDRVFALQIDGPTTAEDAGPEVDFEVHGDIEASGDASQETPVLADDDWEATIAAWDEDDAAESGEQDDPLAGTPSWARTDRDAASRPVPLASVTPEPTGIPPELRDVSIPSWALPRSADRETAPESTGAGVAGESVETPEPEPEPELSTAAAQQELTEVAELAELAEESGRAGFEELDEMMEAAEEDPDPADAPLDADFFESEMPDEANLFTDADPSPVLDLLESAAAEELPQVETATRSERDVEPELEQEETAEAVADEVAVIEAAVIEADLPDEIIPDPVVPEAVVVEPAAPATPAAPAAPSPRRREPVAARPAQPTPPPSPEPVTPVTAQAPRPSGDDVFLVGEFRSRGESDVEEAPPVNHQPDPSQDVDPFDAFTPEPARQGLFDQEDIAENEADAVIDWDLDSPGDPDTILDAQRASADPAAPVSDRIFSTVADAMVVLTIAVLLAIAGASAAGVPVVPFIQAAPVPFAGACLVFAFAYAVFFNGTCGQTLGKMAMRVRVIGSDTFRVGYQKAATRAFYYTLAALPAGLGLLTALKDPEHRALHDRMSGTRVVKA